LSKTRRRNKTDRESDYPDKEAPDAACLEADAIYITLQKKGQEKGG